MAVDGGEEPDYVSDPDDALLPSMRRREASDDEDDAAGFRDPLEQSDRRGGAESEGEGGAPYEEYDDDEEEEYEDEEYEEEEYEVVDVLMEEVDEYEGKREEKGEDVEGKADEKGDEEKERVEKEVEPFVVPRAGPFYMHDDRFRDHRGFRGRRAFGGHKLWDSKDERAWMHDKFEEMNLEDTTYDQARNYRGRYRGRGKARGGGRGYGRGRKDHAYDNKYRDREGRSLGYGDRSRGYSDRSQNNGDRSRGYAEGSKIRTQKIVRGRGPRRYEPLPRNREMPTNQNKQITEGRDPVSRSTSGNQPQQTSSQNPGSASLLKQVFTSSLNSASPPFYPGGSSNPDHSVASKKDLQSGNTSRNVHASVLEDIAGPQLKGKTVGYVGHDKFLVDNAFHHVSGKNVDDSHLQWSSSALVNTNQSTQLRVPGRELPISGQPVYQQDLLPKVVKGSTTQPPAMQQRPVQVHHQVAFRAQHHSTDVSSPPQVQSKSSSEVDGLESVSSKSKPAVVGKEKLSNSQSGPTPFLYGGAPIIGTNGTVGIAHGTQGFAGTPALLPVMQFCGQNPGGLGVPAVGLALPGYVAQSQPGLGNSEMAWMPALASAGALGTSYGPYFAIDGGFYPRPPGQVSSTSRDGGATQSVKPSKSPQISATVSDEAGQRQNKPRRYSEMNFGQ